MKKLGSVILVVSIPPLFSVILPKLSETSLATLAAGLKGVASKLISPELDVLAKDEIVLESFVTNCGSVNLVRCVVPLSVVIWFDPLMSAASVVIPDDVEVDAVGELGLVIKDVSLDPSEANMFIELNPADLVVDGVIFIDVAVTPVAVDGSNLGVVTERRLELKLLFGIPLETALVTVVVRKPNIVGKGLKTDGVVLVVLMVDSDEKSV